METSSKGLIGHCPACGCNWFEKAGVESGVENWTYHNFRLLRAIRNGVEYYKCPDCENVWDAKTGRRLSHDEIRKLG